MAAGALDLGEHRLPADARGGDDLEGVLAAQAQAQVDRAHLDLAHSVIHSPVTGTVISLPSKLSFRMHDGRSVTGAL